MTPRTAAGRALAEALGPGDIVGGEAVRVILAIEAEASAEPGALSDGGPWHSDGDQCTGLHCGNPDHGWDERAEPGALREALDVNAVLKIAHARYDDLRWCNKDDLCHTKAEGARLVIDDIEYAALSREEATSE